MKEAWKFSSIRATSENCCQKKTNFWELQETESLKYNILMRMCNNLRWTKMPQNLLMWPSNLRPKPQGFDSTRFKKTLTWEKFKEIWSLYEGFLESVSNSSQMTWHKSNIYLAEKRVWKLITNSFLCSACCQKTNKPCCLKHTQFSSILL